MNYEVERKFRVTDLSAVQAKLAALGAVAARSEQQQDRYFAHPAKDFSQTDEALRIRQIGEQNFVTYKGPKVDAQTKTRQELELPLAPGQEGLAQFTQLFTALGFRPVATVAKHRRTYDLTWQGHSVEIALDEVDHVGTFVEIEIQADEKNLDAARAALAALAQILTLTSDERRSYLEMLLASGRP